MLASSVAAGDIVVDAAARSGGDGSAVAPFRSLQRGLEAAQPGDTVRVRAGTYGAVRTVRAGSAARRITVVAEQRRAVVVRGDGRALDVAHPFHTVRGIVLDGGYGERQVVRAQEADGLELLDVEVRRGTPNCVVLVRVRDVLIADSSIHHCINHFNPRSNADSHGITGGEVYGLTVRNTVIYLVTGDALQLDPARRAWDDVRIEGCTLWSGALDQAVNGWGRGQRIGENAIDTKVGHVVRDGRGTRPRLLVTDTVAYGWRGVIGNQAAYNIKELVDARFDRVTVRDSELAFRLRQPARVRVQNAVVHDVEHAFRLEGNLRNARIYNVTIGGGVAGAPIRFGGGRPVDLQLRNTLFLAPKLPRHGAGPGNLAVDASAFVAAGGHDYRLHARSPAIDAGVPIAGLRVDRVGVPRPQGAGYDAGAYERAER